jgi:hypothetical protein
LSKNQRATHGAAILAALAQAAAFCAAAPAAGATADGFVLDADAVAPTPASRKRAAPPPSCGVVGAEDWVDDGAAATPALAHGVGGGGVGPTQTQGGAAPPPPKRPACVAAFDDDDFEFDGDDAIVLD